MWEGLLQGLLLVTVGWLLGLFAPVIATYVSDKKKSKTLKAVIRNQLIELQYRLVLAAYAYNLDYGKFDHEFLHWVRKYCSFYQGINKKESVEKSVDAFLQMPEQNLLRAVFSQRDESKGISVKHARLPFLETQLSNIGLLSSDEQTILLEILEHVNIYNETVDDAKNYHSRTFDQGIADINRDIVITSLNDMYCHLAQRSRIIVERIDAFLR